MILTFLTFKGVSLKGSIFLRWSISLHFLRTLISQENTVVSNAQIWNTVQEWSCVTRILSTSEKTRQESYKLSFFKSTLFSGCVSAALPGSGWE